MRLKRLEITGFKSFADKSVIDFTPGVSAIVGPNGCGKSNIVDAIRWGMGEQSVKQLRGKAKEDIIFAGTNGRAPHNLAEVTMVLANENGNGPEEYQPFTEIRVTRRLLRSGESTYLVNKQPSRLKDIHNIFLGSGMGSKSYSIIQQGNIGAITEASPEERRFFIEEAAGISRYKNRRNEAFRKIEGTQVNLVRVEDIIAEVQRQMATLNRQVKKAELYKKFQSGIRDLEIRLGIHYYDEFSSQIEASDSLLKAMKDADIEHVSKLKMLDAAVEDIKLQRYQKNEELSKQKTDQFELRRAYDRAENDLTHFREEIQRLETESADLEAAAQRLEETNRNLLSEIAQEDAENVRVRSEIDEITAALSQERKKSQDSRQQLAELNKELENKKDALMELVNQENQFKNIHQHATNNKESLKRRLKRIDEEEVLANKRVAELTENERTQNDRMNAFRQQVQSLDEQIKIIRRDLDEKSKALGNQVKQVQTLDLERSKIRSRYSALKKMDDNFEWYKDGVKAIMKRRSAADDESEGFPGVIGLMADIVEPKPSFETAVEAALGESLQYILVDHAKIGLEAIGYLQAQDAGRGGFIPIASVKDIGTGNSLPASDPLLLHHVDVKPGFENVARAMLGHVNIAPDMDSALKMFESKGSNNNGHRRTIVTPNGDLVSFQGILTGGSPEKLSGILSKKQELKELEKQTAELTESLEAAREVQKALETDVRALDSDLQQTIDQRHKTEMSHVEAEKELYKISQDLKHARRQLDMIQSEQDQLSGEKTNIDQELESYNQALSEVALEISNAQSDVAKHTQIISERSAQMEADNQRVVDFQLKQTSLTARLDNSNNTLRRLKGFREDGNIRLQQLSRDIVQKRERIELAKQKIAGNEKTLSELHERLQSLDHSIVSNEADFHTIDEQLKENDSSMSEIRKEREETLEKIRMLELDQSQLRLKRENVEHRIIERYQKKIQELRSEFEPVPEGNFQTEKMSEELENLRQKLTSLGDVNLGAITEYKQLEERFTFLETQKQDLLKAIDDLQKVIRKINKISQERFLETFNQINEKLGEVFPRLFDGGSARLELTEPEKLLETGVEFMVLPPGKRLTRLSLLSGGEKALSAIAFVFSIFLIKPTSFCIMDEIDAPLDEANVLRFNSLLKIIGETSQIIMITHKKKTMEFADMLFGITMEKKGVSKIVSVNLERAEETKDGIKLV